MVQPSNSNIKYIINIEDEHIDFNGKKVQGLTKIDPNAWRIKQFLQRCGFFTKDLIILKGVRNKIYYVPIKTLTENEYKNLGINLNKANIKEMSIQQLATALVTAHREKQFQELKDNFLKINGNMTNRDLNINMEKDLRALLKFTDLNATTILATMEKLNDLENRFKLMNSLLMLGNGLDIKDYSNNRQPTNRVKPERREEYGEYNPSDLKLAELKSNPNSLYFEIEFNKYKFDPLRPKENCVNFGNNYDYIINLPNNEHLEIKSKIR